MKKVIYTIALLLLVTTAYSQVKPVKEEKQKQDKPEKYYKMPSDIETADLKIEFLEAVSQETFTKVKVKITNKTNDFILFNLSETQMRNKAGEHKVEGKSLMIAPMSEETKSLMVKGTTGFDVNEFNMSLKGFSRIPTNSKDIKVKKVKNTQIAFKKKEFAIDSFYCELLGIKRKENTIEGYYKCIYKGVDYGIIYPSKLVLRTADGKEYVNQTRIVKSRIMSKKSKENFTVIFAVPAGVTEQELEGYSIDWSAMFTESQKTNLGNSTFDLTLKVEESSR